MVQKYELTHKILLSEARRNIGTDGLPFDIAEEGVHSDRISEWAFAYATQQYKLGDEIDGEEIQQLLAEGVVQQMLDHLVDKGFADMVLMENGEDVGYKITPQGECYLKHGY